MKVRKQFIGNIQHLWISYLKYIPLKFFKMIDIMTIGILAIRKIYFF
jgi:hypothetical protein